MNARPATIVSVLPASYTGFLRPTDDAPDLHLPLAAFTPASSARDDGRRLTDPTAWWLLAMGRQKAGVTDAQVRGNLDGIFRGAAQSQLSRYAADLTPEQRVL